MLAVSAHFALGGAGLGCAFTIRSGHNLHRLTSCKAVACRTPFLLQSMHTAPAPHPSPSHAPTTGQTPTDLQICKQRPCPAPTHLPECCLPVMRARAMSRCYGQPCREAAGLRLARTACAGASTCARWRRRCGSCQSARWPPETAAYRRCTVSRHHLRR